MFIVFPVKKKEKKGKWKGREGKEKAGISDLISVYRKRMSGGENTTE